MRVRALPPFQLVLGTSSLVFAMSAAPGCGPSSATDPEGSTPGTPPVVRFGTGFLTATEQTAEVRIPIVLSSVSEEPIQVPIELGGSASDPSAGTEADYTIPGGSVVSIPAGETSAEFVLVPVPDQVQVLLQDGAGPDTGSTPFGPYLMVAANPLLAEFRSTPPSWRTGAPQP